ncbi:MAG: hypothetical protein NWE92_09925 [Candidatus Bathyarchaeota archaeon]|nr:hypothetical protein [Candidatus Bathyarchaeota archaeon]
MRDVEDRLIKPIINACYPGTLAGLSLAALQIIGKDALFLIRFVLSLNAMMFVLSAFFIFFYTIYPEKRKLWTISASTFLAGLTCSLVAVVGLIIT